MRRFALCVLVCCLAIAGIAQKRAFTLEDLYRLRTIEDPQISPDGKQIAFVVREDNLTQGTGNSEIYVIRTDGTRLRRLTNNPATDNTPRWSPDGRSILFLSTRKNGSQAWSIPEDGGEPRQLTNFSAGVGDPNWSPDGRAVVFASDVFPNAAPQTAAIRRSAMPRRMDLSKCTWQMHSSTVIGLHGRMAKGRTFCYSISRERNTAI